MAIVLTIAGATKAYVVGTLKIQAPSNGRSTASFSVRSNDASYRPAFGAEVIITEGGTRIFGGLLDRPSEQGTLGDSSGAHPAIVTRVSAADFNQYAERRVIIDGGFPAGYTLLQALTSLVAWVAPFGVTLHGSQVTGPTFPEMIYTCRTLVEILNELTTLSAKYGEPFIWTIDHTKVLRMVQPSTVAAPFDVVEGDGQIIGEVTVDRNNDRYANRVYLKVTPKTETGRVETFTGDGSTTTFTLAYTPTKTYGYVTNATVFETLNYTGDPDAATWSLDVGANAITTAVAPGVGDVVTMSFDGTFTGIAMAEDVAAQGVGQVDLWERIYSVDEVPDGTTLQALADGALAKALASPMTLKYKTFGIGLAPGQTQHVTVPMRNLDVDAVITDLVLSDYGRGGQRLLREVTLTTGETVQEGWRDVYKQAFTDRTGASSASTVVGPAAPTRSGPGGPNRAVQYNDAGVFGGDGDFTYYKDENSIVCGGDGSSITAAAFESCLVMGDDCHIADP